MFYEISNGYRSDRRTTTVLCAFAMAWSAAQFEIKHTEERGECDEEWSVYLKPSLWMKLFNRILA